jgi:hypothetical protein
MSPSLVRLYRVVWSVATAALYLLGVVSSVWLLGPAAVLMLASVTGGAAAGTYWLIVHSPERVSTPVRWSTMLRVLLGTAGLSLALMGLGQLAGGIGIGALVLVMLASPDMPALVRALLRAHGSAEQALRQPPVGSLTTEQLCSAWRASFEAVSVSGDPARMALLSQLRRDYLDELERRDPDGFDLWMALYAHPGDDPRPHLSLEGGSGPTPG